MFLLTFTFSPFSHMSNIGYQYKLDKGSKKFICPDCHKKTLVRYFDTYAGEYLPDYYGRCDREMNCNYHLNPYKDGYVKNQEEFNLNQHLRIHKNIEKKVNSLDKSCVEFNPIPKEILMKTLKQKGYDKNVFIQNLIHKVPFPFDPKDIDKVIAQYYLGTVCNGYRTGAITFPYIDIQGRVRAIQVKLFDQNNHTSGTDFLHSIIEKHHRRKKIEIPDWLNAYLKNEKVITCLFGEPLLNKYQLNPIALVEAPKTAIYGTLYFGFPDNPVNLIWLAVYNLSSLSYEKCKVLKDRRVYLFPDLSKNGKAFEMWSKKAKELKERIPGIQIKVSNLLEINGGELEKLEGLDLADYLIKLDWRKVRPDYDKFGSNLHQTKQTSPFSKSEIISELKSENGEKSEAHVTNFYCNSIPAYIDNNGRLFIKTPLYETFTVYPSIEHYNKKLCVPIFLEKNQIDTTLLKEIRIDLNSLSIDIYCNTEKIDQLEKL